MAVDKCVLITTYWDAQDAPSVPVLAWGSRAPQDDLPTGEQSKDSASFGMRLIKTSGGSRSGSLWGNLKQQTRAATAQGDEKPALKSSSKRSLMFKNLSRKDEGGDKMTLQQAVSLAKEKKAANNGLKSAMKSSNKSPGASQRRGSQAGAFKSLMSVKSNVRASMVSRFAAVPEMEDESQLLIDKQVWQLDTYLVIVTCLLSLHAGILLEVTMCRSLFTMCRSLCRCNFCCQLGNPKFGGCDETSSSP